MNNNPEIAGAVQAEPDSADSELRDRLIAVRDEIGKVIVGQDAVITGLLTALLTRGHVLLEGVPGVAKTLMVKAFAAALDLEFGLLEQFSAADHDAIIGGVEFDNVNRLGRADAQPTPLTDRVKLNPVVMPENLAARVDDLTLVLLDQIRLLQEATIIVIGNKADFHALLLVGRLQARLPGDVASVGLGHLAQREQRSLQLILPQGK